MKILHISASYKPAYIYGGPIMSVAKLCEALGKSKEQRLGSKEQGVKSEEQGAELDRLKSFDFAQEDIVEDDIIKTSLSGAIDVEVFTTTANGKAELAVEVGQPKLIDGVPVTYFKRWTKDHSHFSSGLLWGLCKMLRQAQHENTELIVHIHAWWNLVSVLSCLISKWYNVPVILSPRGMLTNYTQNNKNSLPKRLLHKLIGFRLLKYCHIHATSEQEKAEVLKIVQPKSISVIPNLVSFGQSAKSKEQRVRSKEEGAKSKEQGEKSKEQGTGSKEQSAKSEEDHIIFNLIFLSRIEQKKGLGLLFEALSFLDIDFQLTIAGTGDEEYIESLKLKAESLKISERIKLIGQVNNADKFELLANHDLLVLPSYNENFANVVVESLSVGTPILVSEHVGLAEYVKAKGLGWVCTLEPKEIAEKIIEAHQASAKRANIRSFAPNHIQNDFNDEVLAKRYFELYKEVLQGQC